MLGVRFLQSGTRITLEQGAAGEKTPVVNLDLKLQFSVANLLEVLLKSCEGLEPLHRDDAQGVTNDRGEPGQSEPAPAETEHTASVERPTAATSPAAKDLPSAAAQLGLVSPPEDVAGNNDAVENGIVGWESYGEPPPGMSSADANAWNTSLPPPFTPPPPTTEPTMPEQITHRKKNKMLEISDFSTEPSEPDSTLGVGTASASLLAVVERDLKELKQRLTLSYDAQRAHFQRQEGQLHANMMSLGGRIHNLANNMKFQTASISRQCADQDQRLDNMCENIANLENGICSELRELREMGDQRQESLTTIKETQETQTKEETQESSASSTDTGRSQQQGSNGKGTKTRKQGNWTKPIGYTSYHW